MEDQERHSSLEKAMAKSAELGRDSTQIGIDVRKTGLDFLNTELVTGLTFAQAAMQSKDDSDRRVRNQANARKAYDTIANWMARYSDSEALGIDMDELEPRFTELRAALAELGEAV